MADIKKDQEREELHRAIWAIADGLRGSVDGWDFKSYVLGMMFYRYISENLTNYINEDEIEAGNEDFDYALLSDEDAEQAREDMVKTKGFFILPSELFCNLRKNAAGDENLNMTLETIFKNIEDSAKGSESEDNFAGLFDDMAGLENDTIGGFNAMIEKQKKQDGGCYVSTVLFDDESEVLHDRVKLGDIPKMTDKDYTVRGCTALIDAIGGAIHHIGNIHKYARNEDVPEHTMFVITTDGQENASHRYTSEQVKKMIERQKEKYGWEFLFIGANIDAVETAARYGISRDRAVNYNADGEGTHILYESVAKAVCNVRASAPLGANWSDDINADYQKRGRKSKKN